MNHPYRFDGPYSACFSNRAMAMDERHIFIVHEILSAWPFKNALELGSFRGASSTAFIEAINVGSKMVATFCDYDPTESLYEVVSNCRNESQCRTTSEPSWNVLESGEIFDFVLVDANHDLASVTPEIERLTIRRPLCVMAHDTNATNAGYRRAEGAQLLAQTFRELPGYATLEDCMRREGERTERGLFFATTDSRLHEIAARIFNQYKG